MNQVLTYTRFKTICKLIEVSSLLLLLLTFVTDRAFAQGSGSVTIYYPNGCPNAGMTYTYAGSDVFSAVDAATKDTIPLEWWPASLLGGTITKIGLQAAAVMVRSRIMWNRLYPVAPNQYNYVSANLDTRAAGYNPNLWTNCTGYTMNTVVGAGNNYGNAASYQSNSATDLTFGNYVVSQGGVNPIATGFYPPIQKESTMCAAQSDDWKFCAVSALGFDPARSQNKYAWRVNTNFTDKFKFEAEAYYANNPSSSDSWVFSTSDAGYLNKGYMVPTPNNGTGYGSDVDYLTLSPQLKFHVAFPNASATTWYIWARGRGCGGNDDSIHIGISNGRSYTSEDMTGWSSCSYTWQSIRMNGTRPYMNISSPNYGANGTSYTINVWMREDGMRVDRILFTTSASYHPTNDTWANQSNN